MSTGRASPTPTVYKRPSSDTSRRYAGGATRTAASASDIDAVACPLGNDGTGRCGTLVQFSVSRAGKRLGFSTAHERFAPARRTVTVAARRGPRATSAVPSSAIVKTANGSTSALRAKVEAASWMPGEYLSDAKPPSAFPSTHLPAVV